MKKEPLVYALRVKHRITHKTTYKNQLQNNESSS